MSSQLYQVKILMLDDSEVLVSVSAPDELTAAMRAGRVLAFREAGRGHEVLAIQSEADFATESEQADLGG